MKTYKVVLSVFAAAVLALGTISNATAQGNWVENSRTEIDTYIWNGCAQEWWHLTGTNHILSREFWDEGGGFHVSYHYNIQNATAESPRGEIYRAVHSDQIQTVNFDCEKDIEGNLICTGPVGGLPKEFILTRHIRLIGPGPGGNIVFNFVIHLTVDANGPPPSVYFEKIDVMCDQ